jgi:asparagine synthase (glutamine-hydrolysing)
MCGIAGWVDLKADRPANREVVKAMTDAIRHRGPDGEGFHFAPGIGLGHRRLAIIDLTTGDQPMFNSRKTTCIVYNGEIYNFRELRRELEQRGHKFVTTSDTEAILNAYDEWGTDFLQHLRGMFAIALWDEADRTLILARDRIGEKPLHYAFLSDGTLIFGSELKALLVNPTLRRDIDPCAVEEFFALGYIAEPRSIYKGVQKLPAGSRLVLRKGRAPDLRPYWDLKPASCASSEASIEALIERLGQIVKSELVADVPVGAFLSGGTDSSGTTALMALGNKEPISAFTIGFDRADHDETEYASAVARRYNARHVIERIDSQSVETAARLSKIFDEPFGDSSALPALHLMELARKHVKVALSGDGGDELFAGYRRYGFHMREERVRTALPATLRRAIFGALACVYPQLDWAPRYLRARHTFRELSLDTVTGYFWNLSVTDDDLRKKLFSYQLRRDLGGYTAEEVVRGQFAAAPSDDPLTRAQYVDVKTWLPSDILTKVDRTAMAASLEVRVPMLDHSFVEWALGLPQTCKLASGQSKVLLKKAFERLVPHELLYRPKQGFTAPIASWFRGPMGGHLSNELAGSALAESELFNPDVVNTLLEQHRSGHHDNSRPLWLLWMFHRFLVDVDSAPVTDIQSVA